jgi:carbon monoxide dehydrogenase subunit G
LKVALERSFPMPAPADAAWRLLQDVEQVARCMPGAAITGRLDEQHYKGTVAVRFGPASLSFRGELEVAALEPASRTLRLTARGTDSTGGSGASMDLTARIEAADPAASRLAGHAEVSLSGKAAAFGARVADSVAQQVLAQFAANFAAALAASAPAGAAGASADPEGAAASAGAPLRRTQLNGLTLLWGVVRSWLRSLIGTGGT